MQQSKVPAQGSKMPKATEKDWIDYKQEDTTLKTSIEGKFIPDKKICDWYKNLSATNSYKGKILGMDQQALDIKKQRTKACNEKRLYGIALLIAIGVIVAGALFMIIPYVGNWQFINDIMGWWTAGIYLIVIGLVILFVTYYIWKLNSNALKALNQR